MVPPEVDATLDRVHVNPRIDLHRRTSCGSPAPSSHLLHRAADRCLRYSTTAESALLLVKRLVAAHELWPKPPQQWPAAPHPLESIERSAALVPPPRVHRQRYSC